MSDPFSGLPRRHFGVILADCPWRFETWSDNGKDRSADQHYPTMPIAEIAALPVEDLAADDCVLLLWVTWPMLEHGLRVIQSWGFKYKTCGFDWMKADPRQIDMFSDDMDVRIGGGYWTRSNSEPCLLATRGKPQRLNANVRMGIISPRREHSRKPDIYGRIESLVAGPYLELFARQQRAGWTSHGNETTKFKAAS
jgi:N6-adenosine-specific RNA methylase IME4